MMKKVSAHRIPGINMNMESAYQNKGQAVGSYSQRPGEKGMVLSDLRSKNALQLKKEQKVQEDHGDQVVKLNAIILKSEVSKMDTEFVEIKKKEKSGSSIDSKETVQRVLTLRQATRLLRELSRLSLKWRRLFMRVVRLVRDQGIEFDVLTNGLRQLEQVNPGLAEGLYPIEIELTRLANDINHLAGEIIRNTAGGGGGDSDSDDDSNPLERMRETIYMNCRDEIDE